MGVMNTSELWKYELHGSEYIVSTVTIQEIDVLRNSLDLVKSMTSALRTYHYSVGTMLWLGHGQVYLPMVPVLRSWSS